VLDPTCGSGAFLFAALGILEPLYEECLNRMQWFVDVDNEKGTGKKLTKFREELERMKLHPNSGYFIYKSIILQNLYGVDIMREAVEIAKLRLFLKLVSTVDPDPKQENYGIEPLPDIDFNIRSGNTLVGYATKAEVQDISKWTLGFDTKEQDVIEENCEKVSMAFERYKQIQLNEGEDYQSFRKAKDELQKRLGALRDELDVYLAKSYGITDLPKQAKQFDAWKKSHTPFHWFAEYYGIVHQRGGFDVIIGNPPYLELRLIKGYVPRDLKTIKTKNLYAMMLERCITLPEDSGRLGFIVPVSSISTSGYQSLQSILLENSCHLSSFDDRPSKLFEGLDHIQLTVHLIQKSRKEGKRIFATECHRWSANERLNLFPTIDYTEVGREYLEGTLPKISSAQERHILDTIWGDKKAIGPQAGKSGKVVFYSRKVHNFLQALDFVPEVFDGKGKLRPPSELKQLAFASKTFSSAVFCLLNSSLFRWYINIFSDCRHVNKREVEGFRIDLERMSVEYGEECESLAAKLSDSLRATSEYRMMKFSHDTLNVQCIIPKHSKPIIDEIDALLAVHYGLTEEELDFVINYDIKYRMGDELEGGEEDGVEKLKKEKKAAKSIKSKATKTASVPKASAKQSPKRKG